ncbi:hypothetical protein [Streptosporangium sp. NPDC051022]|uniref:hypothetical protein n=1 Tax=Streptosporangium sp. NPDC051022 TaxID=3155752 RepID=UPI0034384560
MSNDFGSPSGDATARVPGYGAPQQPYGQPTQPYQGGGQYQGAPPSYGYPPSGYGAPQGPPPKVKVKPGIGWIVGVWLLFVLSVIIGIGGFAGGIFSAVTEAAPATSFGSGQKTTVSIDPADKPAIYVSAAKGTQFNCELEGDPGTVRLQQPGIQQTVTRDGVLWELALRIGVDKAGDYPLTCTTSGEATDAKFGVGKEIVATSVVGGTLILIGVPSIGFLLAVIVTIVVLVKRSGARRRQAAAAAGQWGHPGPYGG